MTAFTPLDHEVRDRVIRSVGRSLCVEAGAGTGKTTLMVERVLWLLQAGHARIDQIVLISFTEKAAAELRARLRDRLEDALAGDLNDEEHERIDHALLGLDAAHVETIHAFATALLQERPLEAGLAPGFETLDELGETLGFETAWEEWLAGQLTGDPAPLRRALQLGLDLRRVGELARRLHEDRALLPLAWDLPPEPDRATLHTAIHADVGRLLALAAACQTPDDRAFLQIVDIQRWVSRLRLDATFDRALLSAPAINVKAGSRSHWKPASGLEEVRQVETALAARITEAQTALRRRALAELAGWLEGFVHDYTEQRRRAGVAEFDDLLIWARDLLRDFPAVRAAFQQRFRYVIVDEFQDTDPLQVEIIAYLAEDGAHATHWQDVRLAPGKLCIVADPKQAIYRFRNADIAVYAAARDLIAADGAVERITQNFRSVAPLVAWINRVFAEVIIENADEHSQPAYVPIEPAHPAHAGLDRPPLVLLPLSSADGESSAGNLRRAEADAIAAVARRLVADGWPVHGARGEPDRPATYGDIAVLFPTTNGLDLYEEAFAAAGVPYRFEGGRLFYQRQEVRDLTHCVAAVDDPTDAIAVVAALKSSAFAIADELLYLFHTDGGRFNPLVPVPDGHAAIARAFALLRDLHAERNRRSIGAMVEQILARTHLAEVNFARTDGRQAVANLWKVTEQAHVFDRRSGATFRAFARWLAQNQERTPREVESPAIEEGDPVVRMLTVHAAKGLEFPVVLLANLGTRRGVRETWIVDRTIHGVEFRLGDRDTGWHTSGYSSAAEREERHAAAEDRRLLYVACTRARDHLVIPLTPAADGSLASYLSAIVPPVTDNIGGCVIDDQFILDVSLDHSP